MEDKSWIKYLGKRGVLSIRQVLDARIEETRYKISIEEALVRSGVLRNDITAAKKALSLSLEDSTVDIADDVETSDLFNELTESIWLSIGHNPEILKVAPQWVRDKLKIPFHEIMQLPTFNDVAWLDINDEKKFDRRPEAWTRPCDRALIETLRRKIDRDNLSDDFIWVCERTIQSLERWMEQRLLMIRIYGQCTFLLEIKAESLEYVHSEEITIEMIRGAIAKDCRYFC